MHLVGLYTYYKTSTHTSQKTYRLSVIKPNQLMFFRDTINVFGQTPCRKNANLPTVTVGGAHLPLELPLANGMHKAALLKQRLFREAVCG